MKKNQALIDIHHSETQTRPTQCTNNTSRPTVGSQTSLKVY